MFLNLFFYFLFILYPLISFKNFKIQLELKGVENEK